MSFKFIDLFCGIGGFHRALANLGGTCVFASDIDKRCQDIYEQNFGLRPVGDICAIQSDDVPDHDVLCGGFPCFVAGTHVLTKTGYKAIETVTLEDELLTHTGEFRPIVNLQRKVYGDTLHTIRIKYRPTPIVCTNEHPFYVRQRVRVWNNANRKYDVSFNDPVWKPASELTANDYFGMVVNSREVIPEFESVRIVNQTTRQIETIRLDDPDHWFLMGYFLGDGWIQDSVKQDGRLNYIIRFAVHVADEETIVSRLQRVLPITDKKCDTGLCKKFGCQSQQWYEILRQFGKYAHGKKLPEWVQDAPAHLLTEFIAGYQAADGCLQRNGVQSMTTVSYDIAMGLQRIFLKLGTFAGVHVFHRPKTCVIEGRTVNQRDTYTIQVSPSNGQSSFIDGDYAWVAMRSHAIRTTQDTPVYNFEVDTDNSYIVENTIVHNCQPFSNAGHRGAFEDIRGTLFQEIARIVRDKKPKVLLLENVKGIKNIQNGHVYRTILGVFESLGYSMTDIVLSPDKFGVPQKRERVYFLGIRSDLGTSSPPPTPVKAPCVVLDSKVDAKYSIPAELRQVFSAWDEMIPTLVGTQLGVPIILDYFTADETLPGTQAWKVTYIRKNKAIYEAHRDAWDAWMTTHNELLQKRAVYRKLEWQAGKMKTGDTVLGGHFIQMRQSGIRIKQATTFPTLVAIVQTSIIGSQERYITPRECARLQSFPDSHLLDSQDKFAYKQLGNSVNVNVVEHVARHALSCLPENGFDI